LCYFQFSSLPTQDKEQNREQQQSAPQRLERTVICCLRASSPRYRFAQAGYWRSSFAVAFAAQRGYRPNFAIDSLRGAITGRLLAGRPDAGRLSAKPHLVRTVGLGADHCSVWLGEHRYSAVLALRRLATFLRYEERTRNSACRWWLRSTPTHPKAVTFVGAFCN
jgi:hypothetical protein